MNEKATIIQKIILNIQQVALLLSKQVELQLNMSLYEAGKSCIGKKMGRTQSVYACAEAMNAVFKMISFKPIGGDISTYRMYLSMRKDKRFIQIANPEKSAIIISPSGFGNARKVSNGHVGIVSDNGRIMSNNSATGLWDEHLTLDIWTRKYFSYGKYPQIYYRFIN